MSEPVAQTDVNMMDGEEPVVQADVNMTDGEEPVAAPPQGQSSTASTTASTTQYIATVGPSSVDTRDDEDDVEDYYEEGSGDEGKSDLALALQLQRIENRIAFRRESLERLQKSLLPDSTPPAAPPSDVDSIAGVYEWLDSLRYFHGVPEGKSPKEYPDDVLRLMRSLGQSAPISSLVTQGLLKKTSTEETLASTSHVGADHSLLYFYVRVATLSPRQLAQVREADRVGRRIDKWVNESDQSEPAAWQVVYGGLSAAGTPEERLQQALEGDEAHTRWQAFKDLIPGLKWESFEIPSLRRRLHNPNALSSALLLRSHAHLGDPEGDVIRALHAGSFVAGVNTPTICLNSATYGGIELGDHPRGQDILQLRERVSDRYRTLADQFPKRPSPLSEADQTKLVNEARSRLEDNRAHVREAAAHGVCVRVVANDQALDRAAENMAATHLAHVRRPINIIHVGKDITQEDCLGQTSFWGPLAGSGPTIIRRALDWAAGRQDNLWGTDDVSANAQRYGGFLNLWAVCTFHPDILLFAAVAWLRQCLLWLISAAGTRATLVVLHSANVGSIPTAGFEASAEIIGIDQDARGHNDLISDKRWKALAARGGVYRQAGDLHSLTIGNKPTIAIVWPDGGVVKYDPYHRRLQLILLDLLALKTRLAEAVMGAASAQATSQSLITKMQEESERCGLEQELSNVRSALAEQAALVQSIRGLVVQRDRLVGLRANISSMRRDVYEQHLAVWKAAQPAFIAGHPNIQETMMAAARERILARGNPSDGMDESAILSELADMQLVPKGVATLEGWRAWVGKVKAGKNFRNSANGTFADNSSPHIVAYRAGLNRRAVKGEERGPEVYWLNAVKLKLGDDVRAWVLSSARALFSAYCLACGGWAYIWDSDNSNEHRCSVLGKVDPKTATSTILVDQLRYPHEVDDFERKVGGEAVTSTRLHSLPVFEAVHLLFPTALGLQARADMIHDSIVVWYDPNTPLPQQHLHCQAAALDVVLAHEREVSRIGWSQLRAASRATSWISEDAARRAQAAAAVVMPATAHQYQSRKPWRHHDRKVPKTMVRWFLEETNESQHSLQWFSCERCGEGLCKYSCLHTCSNKSKTATRDKTRRAPDNFSELPNALQADLIYMIGRDRVVTTAPNTDVLTMLYDEA